MTTPIPARLRRLVRLRADDRCEYCLIHEQDAIFPHEVDHVIAEKHGGATGAENLALSCFFCNRFKGSDIASIDAETGELVRFFDPRSQVWHEHFRFEGVQLIPLTPRARTTVQIFQINHPDRLRERLILQRSGRHPPSPQVPSP